MGVMAYRKTSTNLVRCDLCKRATHSIYQMTLGDMQYKFCSGLHADAARRNFEKNKSLGVTPNNPSPVVDETTEVGENIDDFE